MRRLALAILLWGAPVAADPLELSLLTYNIHALPPWIAGDDPRGRIPLLLERAAAYDVVLLQEDFDHHDLVLDHARQPVIVRGNDPKDGLLGMAGSGLTVLSRAEATFERAEPYGICAGWLWQGADCLGNKGFLLTRLRVSDGVELDVWNTHLDAGAEPGDHAVRADQLERLRGEIERWSAGRAVVVGGDLNLDADSDRDRALLDAFRAALDLELGVQTPERSWPLRLDYVLFRSGSGVELERGAAGEDTGFLDSDGAPLSDHPALFLHLRAR